MKKLMAAGILAVSLALSGAALAQQDSQLQQFTAKLVEELQLNDTQASQVAALNQNTLDQLQALRAKGETNRRTQFSALRDIGSQRTEAMRDILNEQQFARYQETAAQRRAQLKEYLQQRQQ